MKRILVISFLVFTALAFVKRKPVAPPVSKTPSVLLDAGLDFSCAVVNGELWTWGSLPFAGVEKRPYRLWPGKKVKSVSCAMDDLVVLDEKDIAWGWGDGDWFKSSWANKTNKTLEAAYHAKKFPVKLFDSIAWQKISIANFQFAGIKQDGTFWIMAWDEYGSFGAKFNYYEQLLQIGKDQHWKDVMLTNLRGTATTTNGTSWVWGSNGYGQMGLGVAGHMNGFKDAQQFQPMPAGHEWQSIDISDGNAVAIQKDGSLWFWGDSAYNGLEPKSVLLPMQIGGREMWISASTSQGFTLAIRKDGSLWGRGRNESGQLGDGTTIRRSELVRIGNDNDWIVVKAGVGFSIAAKKDGSVWNWGNNSGGRLGDGTSINRLVPQKVVLQ